MRLIVGIRGASGAIFGVRALELLRDAGIDTHLVISKAAARTLVEETGRPAEEVRQLATRNYGAQDVGAAIASGSFRTDGMIVAPCSIKSASEIAYGMTSTLLTRAADVTLKERRRLVLLVRETPLHTGHLRMLTQLSETGAIVAPPVPAFYTQPRSMDDIVNQIVGRALDLLGIQVPILQRWSGETSGSTSIS